MKEIAAAVASSDEQPQTTFFALERLVADTIGVKLFTVMEIDFTREVASRIYSNDTKSYPIFGEKPFPSNNWTEAVFERHKTFVANSINEIAKVFPDHELIQSIGCGSCLNLPIVINGRIIGTLNCLDVEGHYTPARVMAAEQLKPAGALAMLLTKHVQISGDDNG